MLWKYSPIDIIGEKLDNIYYLLRRTTFEKLKMEEISDLIFRIANYEAIPETYYRYLETLATFNMLMEYINSKFSNFEDTKLMALERIEVKTRNKTTIIKINRPLVFMLEIAILGSYVTSKIINPYATAQLKAVLASLFYDTFIYKLRKIKQLLEENKVEEAKRMIDYILEIDTKNIFNKIIPLPSLIEFVNIEKIKNDSKTVDEIKKELRGEKPKDLLYIFPYIVRSVREEEELSYLAQKILEVTNQIRRLKRLMKKKKNE